MAFICILCSKDRLGPPAKVYKNGPVCAKCEADSKARVARIRKGRKKRKR